MEGKKNLSIIIPVYNEAEDIESFLDMLDGFRDLAEIVFVDGGSSDGTYEKIAASYKIVKSRKKGRAAQMNYGIEVSSGEKILFLHGDSRLSKSALEEVDRVLDTRSRVGCFSLIFKSKSPLMKICGLMSNARVRFRKIAFGDQGIFISRSYLESLGGFKDIPLMEDYQLSMDIKEDGEKIYLSKEKIYTSERRFLKNGRLKTMYMMQKLQYMYRRGEDIDKIKNLYK